MTNDELWNLAQKCRPIAKRGGTMHTLWDVIFDAELHAKGEMEKAIIKDRKELEEDLLRQVKQEGEREK